MKFIKKPLVIDAIVWTGDNIDEALLFIQDGKPDFSHLPNDGTQVSSGVGHTPADGKLFIPTLEGNLAASPGDWIIRGVNGEFYPCKPDVFEKTYERINPVMEPIG